MHALITPCASMPMSLFVSMAVASLSSRMLKVKQRLCELIKLSARNGPAREACDEALSQIQTEKR